MAENAHKSEKAVPCCSSVEHSTLISLSEEHRNLISVANKVFGEGKWSHTLIKQTKNFVRYAEKKIRFRCVSYVKIQLENGNCYEGDGSYIVEKSDDDDNGFTIQPIKIGSAVNALKRVLLSFGDIMERELKQLQRQIDSEQINTFTAVPINLAINFRDLISVANKVFGEDKWNHTVVSQTLDFIDQYRIYSFDSNALHENKYKYRTGCVSFVKVQLENGNFHEDVGYFNAAELISSLSICNARIGSAVNGLKRVLLSFGDKIERELQQLQRQISSEQVNTFAAAEPMDLAINFLDLISVANKVFGEGKWSHTVVRQTLDFHYSDCDISCDSNYNDDSDNPNYDVCFVGKSYDDVDCDDKLFTEIDCIHKKIAGCVSFVKIQLENDNFHEDVGYYKAEMGILSIQNVRIGSAVNGLKRALLSFGEKIEKELQRQVISEQVSDIKRNAALSLVDMFVTKDPMDLIAELPDLISAADKVFGESNWRYTVVEQTLVRNCTKGGEHHAECSCYIKVQLKNKNFHVDIGYCIAKEPTRGLAILNAKIGSAVIALKRVLLSFGERIQGELQGQIGLEQTNDVQDVTHSLDKPNSEKLNVSGNIFGSAVQSGNHNKHFKK